ncbi:MAG: T9SS type A sorting domain-containing protein [Fluviicola sp.]|nr:T9SS type A sorting domain-containing protein [Fluviicola sp.]
MKKIYLSALFIGLFASADAQVKKEAMYKMGVIENGQFAQPNNPIYTTKDIGVEIWTENFDNSTNWTFSNSSINNPGYTGSNYGWNIGSTVNSWWNGFSAGINSTSGGGFAEVYNGDYFAPTVDSTNIVIYEMTSIPLDIPNLPGNTGNTENVIVSFQQFGALFNDDQTVQVSTDGSVWNDIHTNNDRLVYLGNNPDAVYDNPETIQVNISQWVVGNASAVQFRFKWTSRFQSSNSKAAWTTFGWFIDDMKILTQPTNDVQLLSSYIVGAGNEGIEYGRTPTNNLDASWLVGGVIRNFGSMDQPTTDLTADFVSFSSNSTGLVEADSTRVLESTETPTLAVGVYDGTYTVVAGTDTANGVSFFDNTGLRSFEVTNNEYSIDGIGIYPNPVLGSIGTNSFTGAQDGLVLAAMYHLKNTTTVNSLRVMLASGTVPGGDITASIIDTAVLLADATSPLYVSNPITLTSAHVAAGFVDLPFASVQANLPVLSPGAYFAAVELTSNSGSNTISVVDDQTVVQPGVGSMIFIPGDQTYSNGTAIGVRMLTGVGTIGLEENSLNSIKVFPNPSKGVFTITFDNKTTNSIAIYDMLGKEVYSKTTSSKLTVDLSAKGMGVYLVKISNESGVIVKRIVVR